MGRGPGKQGNPGRGSKESRGDWVVLRKKKKPKRKSLNWRILLWEKKKNRQGDNPTLPLDQDTATYGWETATPPSANQGSINTPYVKKQWKGGTETG